MVRTVSIDGQLVTLRRLRMEAKGRPRKRDGYLVDDEGRRWYCRRKGRRKR